MKVFKKVVLILIVVLVMLSTMMLSSLAALYPDDAVQQETSTAITRAQADEEGYHYWPTLTSALNSYGAQLAVYVGVYHDILGPYDRYYIQRSDWRIYFGVVRP